MFARVVEIKTKTGKAKEVADTVHEKVLSVLKQQPGFVDELVLVSEKEGILALSLWKTREDADRYNRSHYGEVHKLIQHLIHAEMKVHTYDIETSTMHGIARGAAVVA